MSSDDCSTCLHRGDLPFALCRGDDAQLTGSTEACQRTCKGLSQQREPPPAHKTRWIPEYRDPSRQEQAVKRRKRSGIKHKRGRSAEAQATRAAQEAIAT